MSDWWSDIGQTSIAIGSVLGLLWAVVSTAHRRRKFLRAAMPPVGQGRWFMLSFLSMGSYLTLILALGLAEAQDMLPQSLFWYLLVLSAAAFAAALMFPGVAAQRPATATLETQEPPADPPLLPVRKSA